MSLWDINTIGTGRYVGIRPNLLFSGCSQEPGNSYNRLHLRWHPSRSPPLHLLDLLCRFLQTRRRSHLRGYHCQQESLGLRNFDVLHAVDYQERLYPTDHDEHELDYSVVSDWNNFLVFWKDFQEVDWQFKGAQ